jgi:putative phage-type endonuclease
MIIQGSPEWFSARLGKATASKITDILSTLKTGESASRKNYRVELVCERLTGLKAEGYTNHHMERGTSLEPIARALYEFKNDVVVDEIGFAEHPTIEMTGASPDGLVGKDGLVEIKCPTAGNHVDTILSGKSPSKYYAQMQWQMVCTGRDWCDFVSYCPEVGEHLALFVTRVHRDNKWIEETEVAVSRFLDEVTQLTQQLKDLKDE